MSPQFVHVTAPVRGAVVVVASAVWATVVDGTPESSTFAGPDEHADSDTNDAIAHAATVVMRPRECT